MKLGFPLYARHFRQFVVSGVSIIEVLKTPFSAPEETTRLGGKNDMEVVGSSMNYLRLFPHSWESGYSGYGPKLRVLILIALINKIGGSEWSRIGAQAYNGELVHIFL